ncbi:hypothetical protein BH23PLA1_BH23PLA1_05190 [soil metagenome]
MAVKIHAGTPPLPDSSFELVRRFPLLPIRNDDHLEAASSLIDRLLRQERDEGAQEYLDALTDLVETYEGSESHWTRNKP